MAFRSLSSTYKHVNSLLTIEGQTCSILTGHYDHGCANCKWDNSHCDITRSEKEQRKELKVQKESMTQGTEKTRGDRKRARDAAKEANS